MTEYTRPPGRANASDDELAGALLEDKRLSLFEVYRVTIQRTGQHIISGKTFRNCTLEGPCVMLPITGSAIENCQLGDAAGDARNLTLSPNGSRIIGALVFDNCRFEGCHFFNVGFTGSPEFLTELLGSSMAPVSYAAPDRI